MASRITLCNFISFLSHAACAFGFTTAGIPPEVYAGDGAGEGLVTTSQKSDSFKITKILAFQGKKFEAPSS
jgi:hypothetical protein